MKILVIVTHPTMQDSLINKRWVKELAKYPEKYTIHELYKIYPDEKIDVQREQKLIESHDKIVFQFPFYWFSNPPLLKKWFDEVLTDGWAFGKDSGYKMEGKKIGLAISTGIKEKTYLEGQYTMKELTGPFKLTFDYIKANYKGRFTYYGMDYNASEEWIEESVPMYMSFLEKVS